MRISVAGRWVIAVKQFVTSIEPLTLNLDSFHPQNSILYTSI